MKNTTIFMLVLILSACAHAPFPELKDDSSTIVSDSKNAKYEDSETITPQPTKPVFVENTKKTEVKEVVKPAKKAEVKKPIKIVEAKQPIVEFEQETIENFTPSVEVLKATFYFRDGSATLENHHSEIRKLAKFLKANKAKAKILGHSSSRTEDTDPISHKMANFSTSLKRAQNTAEALKKAGISEDDIIIEALSDSRPAYLEVMPEGERLNRRAEVFAIY